MFENEEVGTPAGANDAAAVAAATAFWQDSGREQAAQKEVPDSEPSGVSRQNAALNAEYADQQQSLEQDGTSDPAEADGIPQEKTKQTKTVAAKSQSQSEPENSDEGGLDPVLRSIANDSGWTDEKIDRLYKADPELAVETFEQLADQYANLSRQYLQVSPAPQAALPQPTPAQVQSPANSAGASLPAQLSDEALKKFADANGQESADLVKAIRDHFIARDKANDERFAKFEGQFKEADARAVATEANGTIATLQEKFPKLYGNGDDSKTTVSQRSKVIELANMADQIRSGARAQGRQLSVKDALTRAHYIVSRDTVKTEAREELVKQIQVRSKRATAKPTQRNNPAAPGQVRSDDAAIAAAAEKMAEIGMND